MTHRTWMSVLLCGVLASAHAAAETHAARTTEAPDPPPDREGISEDAGEIGRPNPLEVVRFASGSARIDDEELEDLEEVVAWMRDHPSYLVILEGHTDRVGSRLANERLAWRRIEAVRGDLIALGGDASRIVSIAYGEADATTDREASRKVVLRSSTQTYGSLIQSQRPGRVETYVEERQAQREPRRAPAPR